MISFEREILETLRSKNPDLLGAYVCLGLAAGADGVVTMTAPGPLTHVPHKRRAGMVSALVTAGLLKRAPGGYLVYGVSSEATGNGQTEDTEPTVTCEALRCNISRNNSGWTEVEQEDDSQEASREDGVLEDVVELALGEQWEELPFTEDGEATGDGQAEDTEPTAACETLRCNISRNNSGWTEVEQEDDSQGTGAFIDISDLDEPGEIEGMAALESIMDALPAEPQRQAPIIGVGLRRPPVAISSAPAPADDEASVEAKAREMALEAWDLVDARTFQTCEGEFEQFWMCRKRHFVDQARQERAAS